VKANRWQIALLSVAGLALSTSNNFGETVRLSAQGNIRRADVSFTLDVDAGANTIFRQRLVDFATTRQLRNGPVVGVAGGLLGSGTYVVAILGPCEGAIDQILPAIEYAASNMPLSATIISSYRNTAKCVEKEADEIYRNPPVKVE